MIQKSKPVLKLLFFKQHKLTTNKIKIIYLSQRIFFYKCFKIILNYYITKTMKKYALPKKAKIFVPLTQGRWQFKFYFSV